MEQKKKSGRVEFDGHSGLYRKVTFERTIAGCLATFAAMNEA